MATLTLEEKMLPRIEKMEKDLLHGDQMGHFFLKKNLNRKILKMSSTGNTLKAAAVEASFP